MNGTPDKVRVLIATTAGPVELLLLTEEDAAIGRSVACIGGTTATADIDPAYHAFVARPTGIVARLFGHDCYRIDVSAPIDAGASWQLAILAAHALFAAGRLAQEGDAAGTILWATGTVRAVDLTVGDVDHVPEKIARSIDRLRQEAAAGRRVIAALPTRNGPDLGPQLRAELAAEGIEILEIDAVQPLWDRLALAPSPARGTVAPSASLAAKRAASSGRRPWALAAAALVVFAGLAAVGIRMADRSVAPVAELPVQQRAEPVAGAPAQQSATPAADVPVQQPTAPAASVPVRQSPAPVTAARGSSKDCDECPEMVEIPPGSFQMGSPPDHPLRVANELPQHAVRFAAPFAIGKFEVTIDQFAAFVEATRYQPALQCSIYSVEADLWQLKPASFRAPSYPVTGAHPAACVSWNDARAYVTWLSAKTGKIYRLPSEAEWEYAARAGTTTLFSFGDADRTNACDYAKFADASTSFRWRIETCSSHHGHGAAPVGRHRPNKWGLHDMHGNVWEWVEDCWHDTYANAPADGSAWLTGGNCSRRPTRGGSWHNPVVALRVTHRQHFHVTSATAHRGFRVARSPEP